MGLFINFDFNNTALCGNFKIKLVYPPARYKGVTMSQVGIHKTIAAQLGCPNAKVSRTIETLIDTGIFKKQINGQIIES